MAVKKYVLNSLDFLLFSVSFDKIRSDSRYLTALSPNKGFIYRIDYFKWIFSLPIKIELRQRYTDGNPLFSFFGFLSVACPGLVVRFRSWFIFAYLLCLIFNKCEMVVNVVVDAFGIVVNSKHSWNVLKKETTHWNYTEHVSVSQPFVSCLVYPGHPLNLFQIINFTLKQIFYIFKLVCW